MKRIITLLSVVGIMASCKSNPGYLKASATNAEEYAEFVAWKQQKQNTASNVVNEPKKTIVYVRQPRPKTIVKTVPIYTEAVQPQVQKKGWSKAAKGAVIGAGAGAIAGAIIGKKNRVLGAVIGGVAGAGAGFGIGKILDKKNSR